MFYLKRLNDNILYIDKTEDDCNTDSQDEVKHQLCSVCYKSYSDWLEYPLSISSYDQLCEWLLFIPLPIRMFLEKAFLNANSLKYSPNALDLIRSKVPRLSTIYEACLNTFNKNYFGPTLLAVPRRLFCFGSLVILDVARCYLWLFTLYINIKISKNSC